MLKTAPAVFVVDDTYQIMVEVTKESLFWVKIGDNCYFDESNGIMRSLSPLHRVSIPMKELDAAGAYTVCVRPLIERKPYFTETEDVKEYTFTFTPVPRCGVRAYHIADAHNAIEEPVRAAAAFGEIDLLILNGDILSDSGDPGRFSNVYEICSRITGGNKPIIFSRGNHDMRGNYAERFAEYTPNSGGKTYYTFRVGSLWGILLDCAEDKPDDSDEYGHTVCCYPFRRQQTAFLKDIIGRSEEEYGAEGIRTRVVICHSPFTQRFKPPLDIEEDVYREWATLLKDHVKPHVMICGHKHTLEVWYPDDEKDTYGQPCPIVVGAKPGPRYFAGCGYVFGDDAIDITFTDSDGNVLEIHRIKK